MKNSLLIEGYATLTKGEMTKMIIWKDIPNFEGIYQASNTGEIRTKPGKVTYSVRHGKRTWKTRILKQKMYTNPKGRIDARVTLYKDKKPYTMLVSRLVASAWYGLENDKTVNHIDGNSMNNTIENLEWLSLKENIQYGFNTGQYDKLNHHVTLVDDRGFRFDFCSLSKASNFLNRSHGYLHDKIKKNKTTAVSKKGNKFQIIV